MRKEFRMNDEQFAYMMEAMKTARSQPVMYLSGGIPMPPIRKRLRTMHGKNSLVN